MRLVTKGSSRNNRIDSTFASAAFLVRTRFSNLDVPLVRLRLSALRANQTRSHLPWSRSLGYSVMSPKR